MRRIKNAPGRSRLISILVSLLVLIMPAPGIFPVQAQEATPQKKPEETLLKLLGIIPSPESIDYIHDKAQFQLHTLLTEQRHPRTWNLSEKIKEDCEAGLRMLFSVDEDITKKVQALVKEKEALELAVQAVQDALVSRKRIYIYGCGATGRLAKQMESSFWRPFWRTVKEQKRTWAKVRSRLGEPVESQLVGEMTGADRALISSLEGFEDLLLIGRLQLEDHEIRKGDVVICVTEGGETSSVIGTILAALDQWKKHADYTPEESRAKLFFVYNNPDAKLLPFTRSRKVLEEPGITKINLTTGPQSITGSTRMQATTIETFVVGNILQTALERTLRDFLSRREMERLGFHKELSLEDRLLEFPEILNSVKSSIPALARLTRMEAETYGASRFSTYFSMKALITVFIDSTERSPTFRLYPLDTIEEKQRKCWIQVWTPASSQGEAWEAFLGRPFRGLSQSFYKKPFEEEISDKYLKKAALESLKNAGDSQQALYDFSFSGFNQENRRPGKGDLGVAVLLSPEEEELKKETSAFRKFLSLCFEEGAGVSLVLVTDKSDKEIRRLTGSIPGFDPEGKDSFVAIRLSSPSDPFSLGHRIALKMALNAHSTAVMARLGKVIGNTMTNVSPSNLKLIGRATYLIQSHVNDVLSSLDWVKRYGVRKPISYGEANAVLFEAIAFCRDMKTAGGQTPEVALSIIRILESLRLQKGVTQEEAFRIVNQTGLSLYLSRESSS